MQDHVFFAAAFNDDGDPSAIAVVRTNYNGEPTATFSEAIRTSKDGDESGLRDFETVMAVLKGVVVDQFEVKNFVVVAHFIDEQIVRLKERAREPLFIAGRPQLDTVQLAWPFVVAGQLKARSLPALCERFGVINPSPDTTRGDCEALVKVYWSMMGSFRLGLQADNVIRDFGSYVFDGLRSLFTNEVMPPPANS